MDVMVIENTKWSIYINGWFQHSLIQFLPNGKIDSMGTEGFASWLHADDFLLIADELGKVSYKLEYIKEANIWVNAVNYRKTNNNVLLAPVMSKEEIGERFSDDLSLIIANNSAAYKGRGSDIWGHLFFGIDGKIYNYHNSNESFWKVDGGKLCILNADFEVMLTSIFVDDGNFIVLERKEDGDRHYLVFRKKQSVAGIEPAKSIKMDISLSNHNDTLMVIFNSAGQEYNGFDIKYEFFKLPFDYPVDFCRVAQSAPSRWFLDDAELIQQIIALKQYKKVVLLGMSMGAYAAMWFAETLAGKYQSTSFYSIAIQSLTSIEEDFLKAIKQRASEEIRSKTPTYEIVENYERSRLSLDIADFLTDKKTNVVHHVVFDGLNNAEDFSNSRLISDRVRIITMPYGTDHADGCHRIYHSNIVQRLLDKVLLGL